MKKILLLFIMFFLYGCHHAMRCDYATVFGCRTVQRIVYAEKVDVDIFWEWGLFRIRGENLFVRGDFGNITDDVMKSERFCGETGEIQIPFIGSRVYLNEDKRVSLECLYELNNVDKITSDFYWALLGAVDMLGYKVGVSEGRYRIFFYEDLDVVESGKNEYRHLSQTYLISEHYTTDKYKYGKKSPLYELNFNFDDPVYSFSYLTDPQKYKDYKPLKIDPAKLPLESAGYKKLREQEESIGR